MHGMSTIDELLVNNRAFAASVVSEQPQARPSRAVTIVTCMDARLDVLRALGLRVGEAHVLRNAGGVVTDDVIRSLTISQRALGTRSVVLIHHTNCGLESITEEFRHDLEMEVGQRPAWAVEAFRDVDQDVR